MNFQTKVYVGNLPDKCSLEDFRSLFEKHGKVVECDIVRNYGFVHFADGEDAKLAVDKLHDTEWNGATLKVEISYSKVRHKPGMGNKSVCYRCGKAGHWSKECPKGPSRAYSSLLNNNNNNRRNNFENYRGQTSHGVNRNPSINIGISDSSSGFWDSQKNDRFADLNNNGYRLNNPLRDSSYQRLLSSPYYDRNSNNTNDPSNDYSANNTNSSYYHNNTGHNSGHNTGHNSGHNTGHNSGHNTGHNSGHNSGHNTEHRNNSSDTDVMGFNSHIGRENYSSRNDDPCDSYPPPTRYRPYPNAYERRTPSSLLSRSNGTFRPSPLSSSSSSSHHHQQQHHQYNKSYHHRSSSPISHSHSDGGSFHDVDSYARPTQQPDYHEQRRRGYHPFV